MKQKNGNGKYTGPAAGSPIPGERLTRSFFIRDVLEVAPGMVGSILVVQHGDTFGRYSISETEAYRGSDDRACHAARGRTRRTEVMYHKGGLIYMYFVYGMYWMLNVVAGDEGDPQAVLIRGVTGYNGPGKLTRGLAIDGSFYGEDLCTSERIWLEKGIDEPVVRSGPRVGIDYAGEPWKSMPWRFYNVK